MPVIWCILVVALAVANCWLVASTHRIIKDRGYHGAIIIFAALLLIGLALGFWFLTVRYMVSPVSRVYGVPIPIAGGDLINGRWRDGGVSSIFWLALVADITSGVATCVLPMRIWSHFCTRRDLRGDTNAA
jgi:hypothetical protein